MDPHDLLIAAYRAFNTRDLEGVLRLMHSDVDWPNGMEGGRVHGHAGVRDYWTRQWRMIDPRVDPVGFVDDGEGCVAVDVRQVVRDLSGKVLLDQMVRHTYLIRDGLIVRMDIGDVEGS